MILSAQQDNLLRSYEKIAWKPIMVAPTAVMMTPQNTARRAGDFSAHSLNLLNMMTPCRIRNVDMISPLFICSKSRSMRDGKMRRCGIQVT